jgi:hypothetical protein
MENQEQEERETKTIIGPSGNDYLDKEIIAVFEKYNVAKMVSDATGLKWHSGILKIENTNEGGSWRGSDVILVHYNRGLWAVSTAVHEFLHLILRQNNWDRVEEISNFIDAHPELSNKRGRGYAIEQMIAYLLQKEIHQEIGIIENNTAMQTSWDDEHFEKIIKESYTDPFSGKLARTLIVEWPHHKNQNILEWIKNVLGKL